jgi:hypothetical protein
MGFARYGTDDMSTSRFGLTLGAIVAVACQLLVWVAGGQADEPLAGQVSG